MAKEERSRCSHQNRLNKRRIEMTRDGRDCFDRGESCEMRESKRTKSTLSIVDAQKSVTNATTACAARQRNNA